MGLFETPDEPLTAAHERAKMQLARAADLSPGRHLFEAACGTGETARFFVRRFAITAVATNIAEMQLQEARHLTAEAGLSNSIEYALADFHSLPVASASFDTWLCQEALLYATDRQKVMAEACRVVRPGGRIVLTDLLLADHVQGSAREDFMTRIRAPHMWSIQQWDRLFDEMGFDVIERHDWSDHTRHTFANVMANLNEVRADPTAPFDPELIDATADRVGAQLDAARRGDLGWCCYAIARAN
jgi:sarcosine/dimethylglycine N-methyltransferase